MVQKSSAFSKGTASPQLSQILGQSLSEQEQTASSKSRFWNQLQESDSGRGDATVGIYIILAGKARLLDSTDNLIASLGTGRHSVS